MANQLRGEFQVDLTDTVSVDVVLNLYALNLFLEEEQAQLADLQLLMEQKALRALPKLVWCGVRTAAVLHDRELPMNYEKFAAMFGSIEWQAISERVLQSLQLDDKKK